MTFPLFKLGAFGDETALVVAFVIGIAFGFALERGGLGNARKLVSQFYLNDMAVFKVMFTAIVTAGLGLFYLGWIGWLDLSQVYVPATYLWPQILGGLILGFGFAIGGYCPGTSVVSAATGRIDGLTFLIGTFAGIVAFGGMYPRIEGFFGSGSMGTITLPELFGVSYGVALFAVVLVAVGGFAGATQVERWMARRTEAGGR